MIPRPPRLTRTTHSFPTRRSSDLRSTWSVCPLLIGVDCECRGGRRRASDALDDDGGGHAAAGAHRDEAALEVAALELVEHGADEHRAGGADRVAEGHRAAVDVDLLAVDLEIGRASCRERVCQYVYILVVAV